MANPQGKTKSKKKGQEGTQEEKDTYTFNSGRKAADSKWIAAIDTRIEELEKLVGIPELRRLKKKVSYKWNP